MVRSCDILHCNNNSKETKRISYHEIPWDPQLRSQWLNSINVNSGFKEKTFRLMTGRSYDNTFICHVHFDETYYEPNKRRLKHSAVPTKFPPISDVVCESATSRKRQVECCIMEVVDTSSKKGRLGKNSIIIFVN